VRQTHNVLRGVDMTPRLRHHLPTSVQVHIGTIIEFGALGQCRPAGRVVGDLGLWPNGPAGVTLGRWTSRWRPR
jgi:hypothetical protein